MKKKLYFIIGIFLIISCKPTKTSSLFTLNKIKSFDRLSDGSLISDVRCMSINNDFLYIADYNSSELYKLNSKKLSVESIIGKSGDGPGELDGLAHFYIDQNDFIYLQNDFKRSFEIYNKDGYVNTFKVPQEHTTMKFDYRFFTTEERVYTTNSSVLAPILILNSKNDSSIKKGVPFSFELNQRNKNRNNTNLLRYKNTIISISDNVPVIKIYNEDLKLLKEISFEHISEIQKSIKYINFKLKELDDSAYIQLINDAYIYNNTLYLLIASYEPYSVNKVLTFEFNDQNELTFKSILQLDPNSVYKSICANEENIFSFNFHTSNLDVFKLKN